ncbi:MAG: hypothetical protein V4654_13160 [Bdellovibrionota bacterium]
MRFSLLITLLFFSFLGCQSASKVSKSTNSNSKKTNSAMITKQPATKVSAIKKSAANPALGQKSIYEELTGKKGGAVKEAPTRILALARDAKWKRDYVTALKRYNTIVVKYPKSKEARQAYLDKAALYREMGLLQQSKYNMEKAKK